MVAKARHPRPFDAKTIKDYVKFIDGIEKARAKLKGTYMAEARVMAQDLKQLYKDADDDGIPQKPLRAVMKLRDLRKRENDVVKELDIDVQGAVSEIQLALDLTQTRKAPTNGNKSSRAVA